MAPRGCISRRFTRSHWVNDCLLAMVVLAGFGTVRWATDHEVPIRFSADSGIRALTDAEMKQVQAGWLEPKARRPSPGGCPTGGCPGGSGSEQCEDCSASGLCDTSYSEGTGQDGRAPCIDATTAEVYDYSHLLSVGPDETGLSLGFTYASHLADGTNTIASAGLGAGWTHTYNTYLVQRSADFYWYRCDSEIVKFTWRAGRYRSSTGQFYELTLPASDTAEVLLKDGTIYRFRQLAVPWYPTSIVFVLDAIVDPNERATVFEYDAQGRLVQVTAPFSGTIEFEYEYAPDGKLHRLSAAGRQSLFEYDSATGQLSAVDLPNGQRVEWEYNHRGQITRKTVPSGQQYLLEYNSEGKVERLDAFNPQTSEWEPVVNLSSTTNWAPDHETSLLTGEMHYEPGTVMVTDGRGHAWEYDYDARGRVTQTRKPDGSGGSVEYDPVTLRPSRSVDPNGNPTEYEYDARGNRTLVRDAEANEILHEYEPLHNRPTKRTEPDGDEWVYEYDAHGNLVREIDPLHGPSGPKIEYEYDAQGRLIRKTDRNGNDTLWEYDADGHVHKVTDPVGVETTYEYDAFGNVLSSTLHADDPNTPASEDQTTTYTYDARDRVVTQTDPLGVTTKYEYDADGGRTAVFTDWIDETHYRSVTRYEYDERGRLTRTIVDADGLAPVTEYEYDANGNLVRQTNPKGVVTEYEYDSLNRRIRTVLDLSIPADPNDPNSMPYDGLDIEQLSGYDAAGNRISQTDANGHTTMYQYDSLNRLRFTTDPLGYVTEYRYFPPGGGCCGTPGSSLIRCVIDAAGKVSRYKYDKLDRRTHEIRLVGIQDCDRDLDPADVVVLYTYDANGNVLTVTNANGNVTTSTYTPRNDVATSTNGCGEMVSYTYDAAGNRATETRPNANVIQSEYDLNNRLVRTYDALGDVSTYTYDAVGNSLAEADPVGPPITYEYDKLNRRITTTDPMGESTHYEYDSVGNLTRVVDREGNQTVYAYDAANRRTAMHYWPDASGPAAVVTYQYDANGNLTRIADANGNPTLYKYDANGRRVTETFADQTEKRFSYDAVGNLVTREDARGEGDAPGSGNVTYYTYDDLPRLIRREYANGEVDVFTYDKGGRMLTADNNHSHLGYTYDAADRILTSEQTDLPQTYAYTIGYLYDVYANTRTLIYPSGKVVIETRDLRDRLWTVTMDGNPIAEYAYDLADRTLTKTFGNGTQARYEHNNNDWITSLRHVLPDGVTTFAGFAHDYDKEGNRLNAINLQEVIPYDDAKPVTHSETYQYDDMYRLADYKRGQWVAGGVSAPRRHRTWQLDPVHNWMRFGIHDLDTTEDAVYCNSVNQMNEYDDPSTDGPCPLPDDTGTPDDFMVDPCPPPLSGDLDGNGAIDKADQSFFVAVLLALETRSDAVAKADLNQDGVADGLDIGPFVHALLSEQPALLPTSGFNQAHDKNGNLIDDGTREFYYDYQTDPNSCLRSENRLTIVKDRTTGEILGEYWYDAIGRRIRKVTSGVSTVYILTHGWREIEEYEDGTLMGAYTFGGETDEILTMNRRPQGGMYYCHANALGSVIAVTDAAGVAAERQSYEVYGTPLFFDADGGGLSAPLSGNHRLFAGRPFDDESGLYQHRRRNLDPASGRFTARDPAGSWGDLRAAGNPYTYAVANPLLFCDSSGLAAENVEPPDGKDVGGYTYTREDLDFVKADHDPQSDVSAWGKTWSEIDIDTKTTCEKGEHHLLNKKFRLKLVIYLLKKGSKEYDEDYKEWDPKWDANDLRKHSGFATYDGTFAHERGHADPKLALWKSPEMQADINKNMDAISGMRSKKPDKISGQLEDLRCLILNRIGRKGGEPEAYEKELEYHKKEFARRQPRPKDEPQKPDDGKPKPKDPKD